MLSLKLPFKKQQFEAREEAILDAVNQLLSEKGFDLMTMDDVADAVGVAKGSLYKHFSSKEKLAAAVMTRLLRQTVEVLNGMPTEWRAVRRVLMFNLEYLALALKVNKKFYALVKDAKLDGDIHTEVPDDVIVYTLYARSCDPTVEYLRRDGKLSDTQIVEAMVAATFHGLAGREK